MESKGMERIRVSWLVSKVTAVVTGLRRRLVNGGGRRKNSLTKTRQGRRGLCMKNIV